MGGASRVITGDTRDECIQKATEWFKGALKAGLWPRTFIYPKGNIEIDLEFHGIKVEAYIFIVDTSEKPTGAEAEFPFAYFSKFVDPKELKKRYHTFVSAHT